MEESLEALLKEGEHVISLISIHQKALEILEERIAKFGTLHAPTHIVMEHQERSESMIKLVSNALRIIYKLEAIRYVEEAKMLRKNLSVFIST